MEKYDNLGMVGEGSYGMVMKCKHKETGQVVAIKKFLESEDDKMVKKIAMREVRMLRKLRHENLVNLIEVFRRRKRLYLVFEFVDHTVLDDLEKYPNGLNEMTVRKILWQVLRGLEFCHGHNIIHRDIKPENILNSRSGVIKLCDFGFARTLAAPGEVYTDYVATRWYRAPELLVGDTKYGRPVDVWAVGCLITEMLTGDPLFPGDSDIDQLYHIIRCFGNLCPRHREIFQRNPLFAGMRLPDVRDVEPLEKKFPKFSSEVLDLMKQCLRLDPNDRPSSSMLLRHEFFRKDNFEEKVVPELRARILKDAANNMLARKDSNKEQDRERKKKKSKEILSNTGLENQASDNSVNINKRSPDQKSIQSNSPKKQDATNSPKKQDATNSPKKQDATNSPKKQDATNSPKKQDASTSPKKQESTSPKKENLPKSILKASSNPNTPGSEVKSQRKGSDKNQEPKFTNESSGFSKYLPNVDASKQVSIADVTLDTPRQAFKNTSKDFPKTNMPQIMKKRSSDDIHSKSISRDGSITTNTEKIKTEKTKKSSTKRESISDVSEPRQPKSSEVRNVKPKNVNLNKVSSDTVISKEKTINQTDREGETSFNIDKMYNSKSVPPPDFKHHRKEAFRKSPKHSESPTRHSIPPIASQISKVPSPDTLGASPSSSPNLGQSKATQFMNTSGASGSKTEKGKKNVSMKKSEPSPQQQSSFDRAMYPDKTSHFEKMMLSMSSTTSISHPALKKSHPVPVSQSHMVPINPGITGSSGMQYHRHFREDNKLSNLPLWSTMAIDEKPTSLHSSLESTYKPSDKLHRTSEDFTKPREKSVKQTKKESKYRQSNEDKHSRDHKLESQVTRLPDLGRKTSNAQDYSPVNFGMLDVAGTKTKKNKLKVHGGVPTLDVANVTHHKRSRSPSPVNNSSAAIEGNFPSVYSRN